MERAILVIVLIVGLVGVVGLFSRGFGQDALGGDLTPTGAVIAEPGDTCGSCGGYAPVCARLNNKYITFTNMCEATCAGAEIVSEYPCERI